MSALTDPPAPRSGRPRNSTRRPPAPRDMDASPFQRLLAELIARLPGAFASALVDPEGETVDYAGSLPPFDIKVAAAHWRIVLAQMGELERDDRLGPTRSLAVRAGRQSILLRALPDGYALIVLLTRRAGFGSTARAFSACSYDLAVEAGWQVEPAGASWFPITVECDPQRRPIRIVYGGLAEPVEVLGAIPARTAGLARGERGFRIRLASGPEITVIRELSGHWYAEEHFGRVPEEKDR